MKLYVENIPSKATEQQIRKEFNKYGIIGNIKMNSNYLEDKINFCYIDMPFDNQALIAIRELQGKILDGHKLKIKESVNLESS